MPNPQFSSYLVWAMIWAGTYFQFLLNFGFNYRLAGDAGEYALLAHHSPSLLDIFQIYETRSPGYPLILKLWQMLITPWLPGEALPWYEYAPYFFWICHVLVMIVLYLSINRWVVEKLAWPLIHPVWLMLLIIHPGLLGNVSVLLSDVWSVDVLMLGGVLWLYQNGDHAPSWTAPLAGGMWAWAVLSRPVLLVAALLTLATLFAIRLYFFFKEPPGQTPRSFWFREILLAAGFAVPMMLASLPCTLHYGQWCIVNPVFSSNTANSSLASGLDNVRLYWSRSVEPNNIKDPWLEENLSKACHLTPKLCHLSNTCGTTPAQIAITQAEGRAAFTCLITRPWTWPVYFVKKSMALIDQVHYQSYTALLTPPVARHYFRIFSILTWSGLCLWIVWMIGLGWRFPEIWALSFLPLMALATHSLLHVETRYALPLIPGAYLALGTWHSWLRQPTRPPSLLLRLMTMILVCGAGAMFLFQVKAWDKIDAEQVWIDQFVQKKIDALF